MNPQVFLSKYPLVFCWNFVGSIHCRGLVTKIAKEKSAPRCFLKFKKTKLKSILTYYFPFFAGMFWHVLELSVVAQ